MLGLAWGCGQEAVAARFAGLTPLSADGAGLAYDLAAAAGRLREEGAFCPSALLAAGARPRDQVVFQFQGGALVAVDLAFGYPFEVIGQRPDTLGDNAMAAIARAEFQAMLAEMAARYGAPQHFADQPLRKGLLHGIGAALFDDGGGGVVHVLFGYDGDGLAGELRYLAPAGAGNGGL